MTRDATMTIHATVPRSLIAVQEAIRGRVRQPVFCVACEYLIEEGEWATFRDHAATHIGPCGPPDADPTPTEAEDGFGAVEARVAVRQALATLSERDRIILIGRYGLDGGDPVTLDALAPVFGVTRERVRQLQKLAEERLRPLLDGTQTAPAPAPRPLVPPAPALDIEALVPDWLAA